MTLIGSLGLLCAQPFISNIPDQAISYSEPAISVAFTVGDALAPASTLKISATSSNPGLVPADHIVFSGAGSNRFITLVPVGGLTGSALITVRVVNTDTLSASEPFLLNVTNALPFLWAPPDTKVAPNQSTPALGFAVSDLETSPENLVVTATSSSPEVVPSTSIFLGGSATNRTVTVTPATNVFGSALIILSATDEKGGTVSNAFRVSIAPFSDLGQALPGYSVEPGLGWGDFDNDGFLDFVVGGNDGSGAIGCVTKLYRNVGGTNFVQMATTLPGIQQGNLAWGDYNNDGRLDLLLDGPPFGGAQVHRNNGDTTFTKIFEGEFMYEASGDWADFDNDGRMDFAAGGWNSSTMFSRLYRNTGSSFATLPVTLPGAMYGQLVWGDYDKDGYPDLAVVGYRSFAWYSCAVYRNDGTGQLTDSGQVFPGGWFAADWGDYDNDGYLDLLFSRHDVWGSNQVTVVYHNNGSGTFADTGVRLPGITYGTLAWGDFDNDGRLDILMCGASPSEGTNLTRIYRNNGNGTFTDIQAGLPPISDGRAAWGDFDNDGRLDILVTGASDTLGRITRIYHNDMPRANTPPGPPGSLAATVTTNTVRLSWQAAVDADQTNGLTYNLRVGTSPGAADVLGPMADTASGRRRLPHRGNADLDLSWPLRNLASGTYYWSVQAIDNAFAGSAFAPESTFVITRPPTISPIATFFFHYNTNSGPVPFTVADAEAPADKLELTAQCSNTNLIPLSNIVFGGSGTNRTVTLTGAPNQVGSAIITLWVTDVEGYSTNTFLPVEIVNWTPTISAIPDQLVPVGGATATIPVTVGDYETPAADLVMSAESSDTNLVPVSNILFGGAGSNRTVTVTLAPNYRGASRIWVYDSDPLGPRGVATFVVRAQELVLANTNFPSAAYGSVAWADYDNDGRLDLLISGYDGTNVTAHLERNLGNGSFEEVIAGLPGVREGALAWGDFNNDGRLDLLMAGSTDSGSIARVYRNDGNGVFTDINAGLPGVTHASAAWGDFDGDGRLDIALCGFSSTDADIFRVYRNNGNGTFTDIGAGLPGVEQGSVAWGDFDNDGYRDLLVMGSWWGTPACRIYRNTGAGAFTNMNLSLPAVARGAAAWGDADNDGRLDVLVCGYEGSAGILKVYRNNGNNTFTVRSSYFSGLIDGSVSWGDVDNDGLSDVFACGWGSTSVSQVYRNLGDGTFVDIGTGMDGRFNGNGAWGDFDNDGRLDLALSGSSGPVLLFQNLTPATNTPPAPPANLSAVPSSNGVAFAWSPAADPQTPAGGLTYNLRVGTAPGAGDVLSCAAAADGWRRLAAPGNAGQHTNLTLTDLPVSGTYYWSVQAIDTAFAGSPFTGEQSFTATFPPAARTVPPVAVSNRFATLQGVVSAKSFETALWFEYGASTNFGSRLDLGTVPPSTLNLPVSGAVSDLEIEVTNYCRLVASNQVGVTYGNVVVFFSGNPPLIIAQPATNILASEATLKALVSPNHGTANIWFEWGLTTDYGSLTPPSLAWGPSTDFYVISQTVKSLTFGTSYHFRAVASNEFGIAFGPDGLFTTTAEPVIASVNALAVSNTTATVTALVKPNGLDTTAYFEYGTSTNYGNYTAFQQIGHDSAGVAVTVTLTNLSPGTSNYYRAVAFNSSGGARLAGRPFQTLPAFGRVYPTLVTTTLMYGALAWGDYNNDGWLDLAVAGTANSGLPRQFQLYRNTGYGLVPQTTGIVGTRYGSLAWGDYNNDGRLDLLITGSTNTTSAIGPSTRLYRNDGNGIFTEVNAGLGAVAYSSAVWGDFNNDGRLDIFLMGATNASSYGVPTSRLYLNRGDGTFSLLSTSIPGFQNGAVALGDFNNDGKLDILVSGITNAAGYPTATLLFRNNGNNTFSNVTANLPGVRDGSLAWGDYDQDGSLDILLTGNTNSSTYSYNVFPVSKVYRNNGDGTFGEAAAFPGVHHSTAAWGDFDNDGRLDILLSGEGRYSYPQTNFVALYHNTGGGFEFVNNGLPAASYPCAAWGDYDNDGRLDFVFAGLTNSVSGASVCTLYRNSLPVTNTPPAAPVGPDLLVAGNNALFWWPSGADAETAAAGLTYHLRIGTSPGGEEIMAASVATNGVRKVAAFGNVGQNKLWTLTNLPASGTFYWSVQSLDNGFKASAFSPEQMFIIAGRPTMVFAGTSGVSSNASAAKGFVDANGFDTDVWADWGQTTNYGYSTAVQALSSNAAHAAVNLVISNLEPLAVYHCRLVASNAAGAGLGPDAVFAQPGAPMITAQWATNLTSTKALLQAAVNPLLSATAVQFEWGLSPGYGGRTDWTPIGVGSNETVASGNLVGLLAGTTYYFRAVASNNLGLALGPESSFQTAPPPALTGMAFDTNGAFALRATGTAGLGYDIQASTNLVDWIYLGTAPADTNGVVQFTDPSATNFNLRYYRLQSP